MDERFCTICGAKFEPKRWNSKYCVVCKVDVIARSKYTYKKKGRKKK